MGAMTAVETWGRFTRADFEALPEDAGDGIRYELLDGAIVMTPSPGARHQTAVTGLWRVLDDARPDGLRVLVAPLDVYLPTDDILEPDLLVIDDAAIVDDKVQGGLPLMVVEILSPSSRRGCAGVLGGRPDQPEAPGVGAARRRVRRGGGRRGRRGVGGRNAVLRLRPAR